MDILEKLDKLGWEAGNKIDSLNSGGCCVFAAGVADKLSSNGIPVRGIVAMRRRDVSSYSDIDKARNNVSDVASGREWNKNDVDFSHVGLEFEYDGKTYHYDSHGVHEAASELDGMPIIPGRLTVEEMKALAAVPSNWNDWFDRKQIPTLNKLIERNLK